MGAAAVAPVVALLTPRPQYSSPRLPNLRSPHQFSTAPATSVRAGGRVGGRSTYRDDEFSRDYDEQESEKQRKWWSDDDPSTPWWDSEDEDDDDEDEDFGGLGSSVFKVFQAFGWVVPAIVVSLLVGTGSNAFIMALGLPLAQSAIASAFDLIWDRDAPTNSGRPKSRSRRRKRSSSEASSGSEMREERERSAQSGKSPGGDYRSWVSTGNVSGKKAEGKPRRFGGWDELDEQGNKEKAPRTATKNEKTGQSRGKLSRGGRRRRTPLLVRLLVAFFPFLGFWTKLF